VHWKYLQFEYDNINNNSPIQIKYQSFPDLAKLMLSVWNNGFFRRVEFRNEGLFLAKESKKITSFTAVIMMTAYGGTRLAG